MEQFIRLNENDNVAVALQDLEPGIQLTIDGQPIIIREPIQQGHKFAMTDIDENVIVTKDNFPIGIASAKILAGSHAHSHNISSPVRKHSYEYEPQLKEKLALLMDREIRVYHRKNWDIGIRNELWIIPTVSHVNKTAQLIKEQFLKELPKLEVDGIHVFEHSRGISQFGTDLENTRNILQNIALHPNTGGVLVVGLGPENNHVEEFRNRLGDFDQDRIHFIVANDHEDEIKAGVSHLHEIHQVMKNDYRSTSLLRSLKVGFKYGDFDGWTAVTASPLLAALSDYLIKSGGTVVLTGIQHMLGSAQQMLERIEKEEVFQKVVGIAQDMNYSQDHVDIRDGITTMEEKSLGYINNMGKSNIVDAIQYGERLNRSGVNLLQTPSNDIVAATALGAAGCQMVLYATSEGTPFGTFVPTVKIATNSELFGKKPNWFDYNAENYLISTKEEAIQSFINYICDVASGKWVKNEYEGYREIAIWKRGATL